MTYKGKVENGVVVFEGQEKPAEGAVVDVQEVTPLQPQNGSSRSIWDDLRELDGTAVGLPEDMAENHDHYIHGIAKRMSE